MPKTDQKAMDTIVVLELDTPALQIEPISVEDEVEKSPLQNEPRKSVQL